MLPILYPHSNTELGSDQPLYSPDPAPDFQLFGPQKEGLRGWQFAGNDEGKETVCDNLHIQPWTFHADAFKKLVDWWVNYIEKHRNYAQKEYICKPKM